ncbi:putative Mannose-binding lectin protein, partial [Naja naja]
VPTMFVLQPFHTLLLLLGASLVLAAAPETRSSDTNSCTVLTCSNPTLSGLPGRDGRMGPRRERRHRPPSERSTRIPGKAGPAGPGNTELQDKRTEREMSGGDQGWKENLRFNRSESQLCQRKALCSNAGGALAVATNVAENKALTGMAKWNGKHIYLGINDLQTEGKFVYLSGQAVGYTNWKSSEPNNGQRRLCGTPYRQPVE